MFVRTMKIRIRQGSVRIHECAVLAEHEDCVAVEVHCDTKYPFLEGVKGDDGRYPFILVKCTRHSLDPDPRHSLGTATRVTFTELPSDKWYMHAVCEGGRYTIEATFLRRA